MDFEINLPVLFVVYLFVYQICILFLYSNDELITITPMKISKYSRWLGIILASLILCACPEKGPKPEPGPNPDTDPYFSLKLLDLDSGSAMASIPDELVFPNDLREFFEVGIPMRVATNLQDGQWSATSTEPDWCRITEHNYRINGKEEYFYFIDCSGYVYAYSPEQHPAPRECDVHIKAGNLFDKTIHIIQEGKISFVLPYQEDGQSVEVSPAGESADIFLLSNAYKWEAGSDADWLNVTATDGNTLKISAAPRPENQTAKRNATVTLTDLCTVASARTSFTINVTDADPALGGDNYNYGGHIDWN